MYFKSANLRLKLYLICASAAKIVFKICKYAVKNMYFKSANLRQKMYLICASAAYVFLVMGMEKNHLQYKILSCCAPKKISAAPTLNGNQKMMPALTIFTMAPTLKNCILA